uniref:Reverse transcriptase domain-containing protein n=1 Tax=Neogobius melanostomus TaxID=47308 RepID=A0A8C6TXT2_9GOBI
MVNKVLSSLSNSKAKDIYGLDTIFLKKYKHYLTPPITKLINSSLEECTFPTALKSAIVTPIYKSGDKQAISNYRPISLLPVFSKAIEKVVAEQLTTHLENESLLHPMQFGFRTNHSTETACCYFMESIKSSLDTGKVVGAVFLDLRKAFDTVNHLVLLSKLKQYNLSINTLSWIKSYLAGHAQCVRVSEAVSPLRECTMGVPQGSILGPLLFSLYINDLPSVCDDVDVQMYADDTVIYTDGKDHEQVATKLSKAMDKISIWLNDSCLTLNVSKTATMFFSTKPNKKHIP